MFDDFLDAFISIPDFRQEWKVKYSLFEIIFIAVVATIANANSWIEIGTFALIKEEWLRKYIKLENGVPSHDTIERVFEHIDPKAFNRAFMAWTNKITEHADGRIIAVDGKTVKGSAHNGKKAIHIVNAWVDQNNMILGQVKTNEKSNEITAIPELLDLLFLQGSVVTIDAMGTQKEIANKIVKKKGDYVLALKANHANFYDDVSFYFDEGLKNHFKGQNVSKKVTTEKGHGRIERREYYQTSDVSWLENRNEWKNLSSIGMVRRIVTAKERTSTEICYFISSLTAPEGECDLFAKAVRSHWGVESVHWMLDVVFKEDHSSVRVNNGAENQSMLKKIALNIVRNQQVESQKRSSNMKRLISSWDIDYLDKMIQGIVTEQL